MLNQNLTSLQNNNPGGVNNGQILSTKEQISQFTLANNQANQTLRTNQYNAGDDNTPAELARLQRDITLKQLELQKKTLQLNLEVSGLQLQVAQINEATMFPSAPFSSTVQRVFVKEGQAVTPGTPLMLLSQVAEEDPIVAIAYVPKDIADQVSNIEPSILYIGNASYITYPSFISGEAISGNLYGVYFPIPDTFNASVTEKGNIQIDLAAGKKDTNASTPFVPIDAIFQTQDNTYVYIIQKGIAVSRTVTLGQVLGSQVEITSGLKNNDKVILDRNVVAGDKVSSN